MKLNKLVIEDIFGNKFTFDDEDNYILEIHYNKYYFHFIVCQNMYRNDDETWGRKRNLICYHNKDEQYCELQEVWSECFIL